MARLEVFLDDVMADHFDHFALAAASVTVVKQIPDNVDKLVRVWHLLGHTAGFEDKAMSLASHPEDLTDLATALIRDMPSSRKCTDGGSG